MPLEYGLQSTLVAMRLCERLGVDGEAAWQTYYACLLFYVGCTVTAEIASEIFGDDHALTTYAAPHRFGSRPQMIAGMLRAVVPRHAGHIVGWPLMAAGAQLVARSLIAAGHVDVDHPDRLVTSGPSGRSRNPMYVAWALVHLGSGLVSGSGWIVASLPLVAAGMHRQILREEGALTEHFGDEFERRRAAVPRYLPLWPAARRA
jgi:protein-S-isoprenylcysteine O-methyltransferase Ste14